MFVCVECCVLSGRGVCDRLITHQEESYRLWCVAVCDLETSRMRRPWPALGRSATGGNICLCMYIYTYIHTNTQTHKSSNVHSLQYVQLDVVQ